MIDRGRHTILGVGIQAIDYEAAVGAVVRAAQEQRPFSLSALAVHGVMSGALDRSHRHRLNQFNLIVPDGQPVRWALNWLYGTRLSNRVYGPRLMEEICKAVSVEALPIYLFGSTPDVLDQLECRLRTRFPLLQIASRRASQFRQLSLDERDELVSHIRASGARVVFVGLGCPRQEVFVYEMVGRIQLPLLGVGAAFAFHSGKLPQAPPWMQKYGLEWLFRLVHEPVRLWQRYLILNPLYLLLILLQKLGVFRIDPDHSTAPIEEQRFG